MPQHDRRIHSHPILSPAGRKQITFTWQGNKLTGLDGEPISAALYANNIKVFGHHVKDHAPQGLFCANGQCSQCMVFADGKPVKACIHPIRQGMRVDPVDGLPGLPPGTGTLDFTSIPEKQVPVLIIGGGPSGLSAAMELAKLGIKSLLVDDKSALGGKLVLQTHRFFGSKQTVYAGTRGIDIAENLSIQVSKEPLIEVWSNSTALAVFSDKKIGILKDEKEYYLVEPECLLIACGAREKFITFPGNTLPGIMGAGAFQTLLNRDQVKPATRVFIVGGGNVGLIAGYHAIQAGIEVAGLAEALPECSGYRVHMDKLVRLGVPVFTSHTILSAYGKDSVEKVVIAALGSDGKPVSGTEKTFSVDGVLIAVGLEPIDELFLKAKEYGMKVEIAGDAEEIAEASAAIYSGKLKAHEVAALLGMHTDVNQEELTRTLNILKAKPGIVQPEAATEIHNGVMPVIHCRQEIPCDPCVHLCPKGFFYIEKDDIRTIPVYKGDSHLCIGCERCVAGCPGLAITMVDYRKHPEKPRVSIAVELERTLLEKAGTVNVTDIDGNTLTSAVIQEIHQVARLDHTFIVEVEVDPEIATKVAGIQIQAEQDFETGAEIFDLSNEDTIICRCERVTVGEIRALIRSGARDFNEIKTITRAGAGSCGGKTCRSLILRLFREEGIPQSEISLTVHRPLFKEVELGVFAGLHLNAAEQKDNHD
jgi:NADPH-dependent 2,4-dienoyl-CoA reductase/sulfur reductase-like enzyme/Fe-S-cluster-containing hydrogenase component 2/bacterioferritin-associated ferredoxin